jgi:hypothetical protein
MQADLLQVRDREEKGGAVWGVTPDEEGCVGVFAWHCCSSRLGDAGRFVASERLRGERGSSVGCDTGRVRLRWRFCLALLQ